MGRRLLLTLSLAAAAAALGTVAVTAVAGAVRPAPRAAGSAATVSVRRTKLGRILVDGSGRTLYLFEKDRHGRSACAGACAAAWPPMLTRGRPTASHGAGARMLGTAVRKSGSQVTYAGHPLYTFSGDHGAGQTSGEGSTAFGAAWYVLAPDGRKIDKS